MTLIELGFLVLIIFIVALAVQWGRYRYGWLGVTYILGGLIVVFVILPSIGLALVYLTAMLYTGNPYYPACRTGECLRFDYQVQRLSNGERALICRCGTRYKKRGRRFFEVQPDGSFRRYMIWKAFRGWFPDV